MHAAVGKAGLVLDVGAGENPTCIGLDGGTVDGGGQHLLERLAGIDKAVKGRCFHARSLGLDVNHILLRGQVGVEDKAEGLAALGLDAGGGFQGRYKALDGSLGGFVQGGIYGNGHALHVESALGKAYFIGAGNDGKGFRIGKRLRTGCEQGQCSAEGENTFHGQLIIWCTKVRIKCGSHKKG